MSVCVNCGLPKELCVCETIAKEQQKIKIRVEKRKFGRFYTIIEGIDKGGINLGQVTKKLKARCACGGTAKRGKIELQGNHKKKVKEILVELGFSKESIES